jgi:hypothetical protein
MKFFQAETFSFFQGPLSAAQRGVAIVGYLDGLNEWLAAEVDLGKHDLQGACEHALVHGVLLAFRYTMEELDWRSDAVSASAEGLRVSLKRMLGLILKVTALALWVVSVNALNLKELERAPEQGLEVLEAGGRKVQMYGNGIVGSKGGSDPEEGVTDEESDAESDAGSEYSVDSEESESESVGVQEAGIAGSGGGGYSGDKPQEFDDGSEMAPREQMVMVACWLSMKEVSLLLGTVTRRVPLQGAREGGGPKAATKMTHESAEATNGDIVADSSLLEAQRSVYANSEVNEKHAGQGREEETAREGAALTQSSGFVKRDSGDEGLLDSEQLRQIGDHFVTVLLGMKHNGAIDKTQLGFVALCERLLKCGTPE